MPDLSTKWQPQAKKRGFETASIDLEYLEITGKQGE
jgi:hypothetical protein